MAWSDAFLAMLDEPDREPVYVLEALSGDESDGWGFGQSWRVASHKGLGIEVAIGREGGSTRSPVSFRGQRLHVDSWRASLGAFTVTLNNWTSAVDNLRRGLFMVLRMGFAGWALSDFETVGIGILKSFQVRGPVATLTVDDVMQALVTRRTTKPDRVQYFNNVGKSAAVNGGTGLSGNVTLSSTDNFEKAETHSGAVMFVESDGSDFFITKYESIVGSQLRGLDLINNLFDTDNPGTVVPGQQAVNVAYLKGHPFTIFRRLITSTGEGTNGAGDVYPRSWSVGIPEAYIASTDIATWESRYSVDSGEFNIELLIDSPQSSGLSWLLNNYSLMGIYPSILQGQLTLRSALDPTDSAQWGDIAQLELTDADIAEVIDHSIWDDNKASISGRPYVRTEQVDDVTDGLNGLTRILRATLGEALGLTDTSNDAVGVLVDLTDLPGQLETEYDISGFVRNNKAEIATAVAKRVGPWVRILPETATLRVRRWRASQITTGNVILLTTDKMYGREGYPTQRACLVTSVDLFNGPSSVIQVLIP